MRRGTARSLTGASSRPSPKAGSQSPAQSKRTPQEVTTTHVAIRPDLLRPSPCQLECHLASRGETNPQLIRTCRKKSHERKPRFPLISHVAVEHELPGVRPKRNLVDLFLALVLDPGVDHVLGEHAAFEQERVVALKSVERLRQRARHLLDLGHLLAFELVDVLVEGLRRQDLVLDAVQARHEASREPVSYT